MNHASPFEVVLTPPRSWIAALLESARRTATLVAVPDKPGTEGDQPHGYQRGPAPDRHTVVGPARPGLGGAGRPRGVRRGVPHRHRRREPGDAGDPARRPPRTTVHRGVGTPPGGRRLPHG